jgi:hypothetical protein
MTKIRTVLMFAMLLWGCRFACAQESPQIMLAWSIANSGTDLGATRVEMRDGWPTFIEDYVVPAIEWARESDVEPCIVIQHPFGQYSWEDDDAMALDGYDYAVAAGAKWLTNDFATSRSWKPITADVQVYAYVGGVHLTPRLRDLPPAELRAMIIRNLKPLKDAGFRGVFVDFGENAITHPFAFGGNPDHAQSMTRSADSILLEVADSMFTADAGIEAAPRNFAEFVPLHDRDCFAFDEEWRFRYGGFTSEQCTQYGYRERNTNHVALGYNRSVLTGKAYRTLGYEDDPTDTLALAKLIVSEGDIPAFNPLPFILNDIPASEVVE